MNEQRRELQLLLDKTVAVLVRKVYMEGIFNQATDSRYWELWNRQKLSSELELKRRCILELNQELTNKLIELERHFNSLELNKFHENEGTQRNRRALQNWHGRSRQIQSLRSLHNTMTAQLAAAEQLSGSLSKQMAALSIEPSGKHDVKRQLFESIGLAYVGDTEMSPARNRTSGTPANKEYSISSGSIAAKEQSRINQTSFAKGSESETARRRRDSFDRSWASFDPPKTTVKRMLKEDYEKGSSSWSLLNINKQYLSPQLQKKSSEVAHSTLLNTSGAFQDLYKNKGTTEQLTASPTSLHHITAGLQDRGIRMSSTKSFSALPPSSVLEMTTENSELGASKLADEKSQSSLPFTGKSYSLAANEPRFVQHSDTSYHPLPSMSASLPKQYLTSTSDSTQSLDHFKIGLTESTPETKIVSETPLFDSKIPVTPASAFSSGPNVSEKGLFSKKSEKATRPNDGQSASSQLQPVMGSSLLSNNNYPSPTSLVSKPNSSTVFPATPFSSEASVAAKQGVSQPQTSVTSARNLPFKLPSSTYGSDFSSVSSSSSIVQSESPSSSSHPSVAMYGSKTEGVSEIHTKVDNMPSKTEVGVKRQTSVSQPELKLGPSASPAPSELSTSSMSESQDYLGGLSKTSMVTSVTKVEMPSATEALPTGALSSEGINGSMKSVVSNSSHEEEMEEEAPETDQTEFAFANLGGFGIGSTQNSTTPKANPFGEAVLNKNTTFATSPYTMSASSSELFRPASFNFQSPQPPQPLQPTSVNFSGGFSAGVPAQVSPAAGFGQTAHVGAGQQALGSVLGTFGQSRQIGTGLPGSNAAPASGFGGGFAGISAGGFGGGFTTASGGGFASLAAGSGGFTAAGGFGGGFTTASGGGFASLAAGGGGFTAAATGGGGFATAANAGGGFAAAATAGAGGGFLSSAAAGAVSGGGFGAFSNQPASGGFSAFGGSSGIGRPPSELFTQMRK